MANFAQANWYCLSSILNQSLINCEAFAEPDHCDVELSFEVIDATCNGSADGSLLMTIVTGTAPYMIDWDNDGTGDNDDTEDLFMLNAGSYSVTVTDADGCVGIGSFDIYEPDAIDLTATISDVTNAGASNGAIDLVVAGGTLPYTFEWDNDGTGDNDDPEDLELLPADSYGVTVTDVNGCTGSATFILDAPACGINLSAALAGATCNGYDDGKINLAISGGQAPYAFDWTNDGVGDNDDDEDLHNLSPNTYSVTVTDDVGCTANASFVVAEPSPIFLSSNIGDVTSIGGNDGWIDLTATGSAPPYTYDWSNDGTGDNNDTQDLAGLTAGAYSVLVTDEHGCTASTSYEVQQPLVFDLALRITLDPSQPTTVMPGATVTFKVTVFNQGAINASNILVIDYLPANMTFPSNNFGWFNFGAGPTWLINSLPAGASISKNIRLVVNNNSPLITLNNYAEITSADDNDPDTADLPVDYDSRPNAFQFDDPGGQPNGPANDVITGNGTGAPGSSDPATDEDDHDGAAIIVNIPSVSLGNLVFQDKDNDGLFNNQDAGIQGVVVELFNAGPDFAQGTSDDVHIATETTDVDGIYLFTGLPNGYYYVKLNGTGIPPGMVSSTGDGVFDMDGAGAYEPATGADFDVDNRDDGTQNGNEISADVILLTLGGEPAVDVNTTLDFGLYQPLSLASLGDFVWYDNDNDGLQDPDEQGVQGIIVRMYDLGNNGQIGGGDDQQIDTEVTNGNGYFSFSNIIPGDYYLIFDSSTFPSNYLPASQNIGNEATDSDVNSLGVSDVVSLAAGDAYEDMDFGLRPILASVGNFVWMDTDHNGFQNAGELGVEGVSVQLFNAGINGQIGVGDDVLTHTVMTNSDGFYSISDIFPGTYYIVFDLTTVASGLAPTMQNATSDNADSDADATGATDVFVLSVGEMDETIDFGLYETHFDLALTKQLSPNQSDTVDINDVISYDIAVTNQGNTPVYAVQVVDHIPSGLFFGQNNPGWTLQSADSAIYTIVGPLNPGETTNIQIKMMVLYGASGQTIMNQAEIIGAKDSQNNDITDLDSTPDNANPNEDDLSGITIELVPHDPTGWIYCDKTGRIITGGTISVTGPNGIPNSQVNIIHDGSSGYYEFYTDGTPGVYTISYSHPNGYPFSPDCAVQPGPIDLTGMPDPYILGVDTVTAGYLSDVSCASNPYYLSFNIEAGDPVVFQNNLPLACTLISGTVTDDTNFNDIIEGSDTPISGITIFLFECADLTMPISTTTTNAMGQYLFDALQPGDYVVAMAPLAGYRFVTSLAVNQMGFSDCFTLNWGESNTVQNFGIYECPTINAGPDISHCSFVSSTQISANLSHGTGFFNWTPADGLNADNIENPTASPMATTAYNVVFDDGLGCSAFDDLIIFVGSSVPFMTNAPFVNQTVQCAPLPSETPVFADNCDLSLTITSDTVITSLACGFIQTITWTATNDEGNSDTFVQTLTVADTQIPSIAASHPFFGAIMHGDTLYADCSQIPSLDSLAFSSFDNCGAPSIDFAETVIRGNCPTDGFYELRNCGWTSTDACGNKASLNFVVIVTDNLAPVLSPAPADMTYSCGAVPAAATLTATDNCDADMTIVLTEVPTMDANGCLSRIVRTWTVQDDCGNSDSATQIITVFDNIPPTLVGVPANLALTCGTAIPAPAAVTATDACDASIIVILNQAFTGNPATGCYSLTRTWTATDDCGNTAQAEQVITISDNTPPTLVGVPADQNYDCAAGVPGAAFVTATDACDAFVPAVFSETINGNSATGCFSIVRTWTATDDCGNSVSDSQTINVSDNTPPILSAIPADLTLDCSMPVPAAAVVTASDLCDASVPVIFTQSTNGNPATACYVITRRWSATDDCGNTTTASQTITVRDTQAPVLSATPANATYTCLSEVPAAPTITATDNCDSNSPVLFFTNTIGNPAGCNFQITRIWAAADDCGNSTVWTQTITVNDDQPPVFTVAIPANTSISCDLPLPAAPTITATDNCDANVAVTMTESYFGDPTSGCYILTRTWTATDDCGNTVSDSQDIMVIDLTPPNFVGLPANATVSCDNLAGSTVTATDNCDANVTVTISDNIQSSVLGCVTQVVRTWTASDDCGNTRIASRTFTVQNTDAPTITIIEPLLLGVQDGDVLHMECDALPGLTAASATASADCCGAATVTFHETVNAGNCGDLGYYAVMRCGWIATDCCGNLDSLFFTVYVEDHTPPNLTGVPANIILPLGSALPAPPTVTAHDNCDNSTPISYSSVTTGPASDQLTNRTWTATDDCGNTAISVQTIRITNDMIAPLIANVPSDITIEGPVGNLPGGVNDVTVTDNIDEDPAVSFSEQRTGGICCYVITRRWTATDDFGNTTIAEQKINVVDTQAPVIAGALADYQSNCVGEAVPMPQLTVSDNCTTNLLLQFHADTIQLSCGIEILRTWTATDECHNSTSVSQTLTLIDSESPILDSSIEINASFYTSQNANPQGTNLTIGQTIQSNQAWAIGNQAMPLLVGIATDNCTAANDILFKVANIVSVNNGCEELWTIEFLVLDACGNAAAETFTATASFTDDKAPVFASVPQNLTANCGSIPAPALVLASDETSNATIHFEETAGTGCPMVITRRWTATDACGNSAIAQQQITVTDNTAPTIANVPSSSIAACGNIPAVPTNITATDACAGLVAVLFYETIQASNDCHYAIIRTWMATDNCGNSTVKQQYIWVADNTPPAIAASLPTELTVACDAVLPPAPTLAVSDNCDDSPTVSLVEEVVPGTSDCSYSVLRKWTVTDHCGNQSIAQQTIKIVDTTLPTLASIPANLTVNCGSIPPAPSVLAGDNCDTDVEVIFKETHVAGCPAKILRTWKAIDNCGNEAEATQTILVVDNQQPLIAAPPSDLVVGCGEHLPTPAAITAIDICSGNSVTVAMTEATTPTPCGEDIVRTWTATDVCGNSSAVSQLISVVDDEAPTVAAPTDLSVNCGELPPATTPAFTDECDANLSIHFTETSTQTACGEDVLRTWTATDDCGNSTTVDQLIQVTDLVAPSLSFKNPILTGLSDGDTLILGCSNDMVFIESDVLATDHCGSTNVQMAMHNLQSADCASDGYLVAAQFKWTATDACGNAADLTLNVRMVDNESPVFEPIANTVVVNCGEAAPDFIAPNVSGDCSEVSVAFASQTLATAYGQDIVGTWTAMDACGNSATTTQTMQVYTIGAAQLVGVPADLVVDLSAGETVPVAPAVTAIDNCSGDPLAIVFEENSHKVDGCNTIIERTWSAVGLNGVTVGATQTIAVEDKVVYAVSSVADSCYAGNGSVVLSPNTFSYYWSDPTDTPFATGATQNGLIAGNYQVTATNANGCVNISDIRVEAACDCSPANVRKLVLSDTKCGEAKGKAFIQLVQTQADYSFSWTPDIGQSSAGGYGKTLLPAGHYEVRITFRDVADCVTDVAFEIDDNCPAANEADLPTNPEPLENAVAIADPSVAITVGNLMTPDGDGKNDYLTINGIETIPSHELRVFNALGQLVFRTKQYNNNWGGSWGQNNIPSGTYFYLLEDGKGERYSGHIQILR